MSPEALSSRSTPVCDELLGGGASLDRLHGMKAEGGDVLAEARASPRRTTVSALLNQTLRGPICWPISAANSESGRSMLRQQHALAAVRRRLAVVPHPHLAAVPVHDAGLLRRRTLRSTSLSERSAQWACRHLNPGGLSADSPWKITVSVSQPLPPFAPE